MNSAGLQDRVLLVDDDGVTRLMVRRALERRAMQVTEAASGEQGIAMALAQPPDIIVLDAMMPGKDGFATCAELCAHPSCRHVPILMLTALADDKSIAMAYEAGATDFYIKSTQTTLLVERVRHLLRAGKLNKELATSQVHLAKAQRLARLGSFQWRPQHRRITGSAECFRILAIVAQPFDIEEERLFGQFAASDPESIRGRIYADLRDQGIFCGEFDLVVANDMRRHIQIEAEAEVYADGEVSIVHGTVQDITERRQAEEQVRRLANYDTLTGLPNRNLFAQRFERALAAARRGHSQLAVMFVDLDRFKVVNDTLGHRAGDSLLCEVAARLNRCVRGGDSVTRFGEDETHSSVARLGGDEFIVLLTALKHVDDASKVADRMLEALRQPLVVDDQEIWISASVGIASYPKDGETAETLLMRADSAMYSAKANGRDGHKLYTPSLDSRGLDLFRLEADLRKALDRNEFRLHYQPIINVTSGKIVDCEMNTEFAQRIKDRQNLIDRLHQHRLGNFNVQAIRVESGFIQNICDHANQIAPLKMAARQIDSDINGIQPQFMPGFHRFTRLFNGPLAHRNDEAGFLRQGNEVAGWDKLCFSMNVFIGGVARSKA